MFEKFKLLFFTKKNPADTLKIKYLEDPTAIAFDGFYIIGDGLLRGPYKREKDAKGVLTRIRKAHA